MRLLIAVMLAGVVGAQTPGRQLKIVVLEGQNAINNMSLGRAKEPVVQIVDEHGAPVKNATVAFLLPDFGPGGQFADDAKTLSTMTDEHGRAVGRGLHPNKLPGQFQIRVTGSYAGETARATITQTNAEPSAVVTKGSSKKFLWIALAAAAAAGGAFAAKGSSSGSTPSSSVPNTPTGGVITPGTPVFQGPH